jgi:hypothetical protein
MRKVYLLLILVLVALVPPTMTPDTLYVPEVVNPPITPNIRVENKVAPKKRTQRRRSAASPIKDATLGDLLKTTPLAAH